MEAPPGFEPGYNYTIKVWPTSNLFKAGHQIRLELSSSNFPMFDRNPNTGHPFGQDAELKVADQTILYDKDHLSMITLPIVAAPPDRSAAIRGTIVCATMWRIGEAGCQGADGGRPGLM